MTASKSAFFIRKLSDKRASIEQSFDVAKRIKVDEKVRTYLFFTFPKTSTTVCESKNKRSKQIRV